ncbi:hypothetical protein BsWGS_02544 [Bradybaena similaris]
MLKIVLFLALACVATGKPLRKIYNTPCVRRAEDVLSSPQDIRNLTELARALRLCPTCSLEVESKRKLPCGKWRQTLRVRVSGLPLRVFTLQATVTVGGVYTGPFSGFIPNITSIDTSPSISKKRQKKILAAYVNNMTTRSDFQDICPKDLNNFTSTKSVDVDLSTGVAVLVYKVQATTTGRTNLAPRATINAVNGDIIDASAIATPLLHPTSCLYSFIGGNEKCPGPVYGPGVGEVCLNAPTDLLHTVLANDKVKVYTMNGKSSIESAELVKFLTAVGPNDAVNGASSPAVDAFYYANEFQRFMFSWTGLSLDEPVKVYVHAGKEFKNSFYYGGTSVIFGDGSNDPSSPGRMVLHPLPVADVIAHEIAHAYTSQLRSFDFRGESVAVNEAFSDVAAVVFSAYLNKGEVKRWSVGYCAVKDPNDAIRSFDNPSKDNFTNDNVQDFIDNGSGYRSLGVFDKTFYCIVIDGKITIKEAFQMFVYANTIYWNEKTAMLDGACDVYKSASDLGLQTASVARCFREVGINLTTYCSLAGTGTCGAAS